MSREKNIWESAKGYHQEIDIERIPKLHIIDQTPLYFENLIELLGWMDPVD